MEAIGYVRVSTQGQCDGEGLGVQVDKIRAWCQYQQIPLTALEQDAGVSGAAVENRPAFKRALRRALELGHQAVFVVAKLDRFGRNALDVQENLALLLESGVRVVALGDSVDSASGMGTAILTLLTGILASFAQIEKDTIRTRLLDGRKRADREQRVYASEPRYGRRVADGGRDLVVEPVESKIVELVLKLRSEGRSYRAICNALHEKELHPRRASTWSPTVVRRIATGQRSPKKSAKSKRLERVRAELLSDVATV